MMAGDGIVEFTTDPNRCNIALFMDGAKSATASTKSSICGLVNKDEEPGYVIGFGGSPGL
jgi:hypothetical protein